MEKILLASDYPNLTQLKLFNFNGKIVSRYFTDCYALLDGRLKQLTTLILHIVQPEYSEYYSSNINNM
ncbi:unnamed protein product, partial [Rotaria sp. Silwood2]